MSDRRVAKIISEKTDKGAQEFRAWLFDVRSVTSEDDYVHDFLDWIADPEGEVTGAVVVKKLSTSPTWPMPWLNKQLYGILSETATGKMKKTVMTINQRNNCLNTCNTTLNLIKNICCQYIIAMVIRKHYCNKAIFVYISRLPYYQ